MTTIKRGLLFGLLPSLLLSLALLQATSVQGFSVPTKLQIKSSKMPPFATTTTTHRRHQHPVEEESVFVLKASEVVDNDKPKSLSYLWRQQKVVVYTSIVVALTAALTRHVAFQGLRRNMLWGTVIFMVGDWGAQLLTHMKQGNNKGFVLDDNRFVISSVLGSIWAGIANPSVYATAESILPGASVTRVLLKMLMSCAVLSTAGNYITMIFRRLVKQSLESSVSKRQMFRACLQSCNRDFLKVLQDDLKVWPLYDIICYSLIPPSVRPITNAFMASAWSMYMSIASAKPVKALPKKKNSDIIVEEEETESASVTEEEVALVQPSA